MGHPVVAVMANRQLVPDLLERDPFPSATPSATTLSAGHNTHSTERIDSIRHIYTNAMKSVGKKHNKTNKHLRTTNTHQLFITFHQVLERYH